MKRLLLLLALSLAAPLTAHAADFSAPVLDLTGKPSPSCDLNEAGQPTRGAADLSAECRRPLTYADVAIRSLQRDVDADADPRRSAASPNIGKEKVHRFLLQQRIYNGGDVALEAGDVTMLKDAVARMWPPVAVYRFWALVDPESVKDR